MESPRIVCPECGEAHQHTPCEHCGHVAERMRALPPDPGGEEPKPCPPTRLVREFKGPTIEDLIVEDEEVDLLPGRVQAVLRAIEQGDLARADRGLDRAVGSLIPGPGFGRRDDTALTLAILVALFVSMVCTTLLVLL